MNPNQPRLAGGVADPHLMLAFEGTAVPDWVADSLEHGRPAGFSLFRGRNIENAGQTAELTLDLQKRNRSSLPLLIAADQEGGQLQALAGSTPLAGNMALGATGDEDLAFEVGAVIGRELRAVGINVNYAPSVDVATLATNPSLGVRSFGSDPAEVTRLAVAVARGMAGSGVITTAKHFPGKGEAAVDPHHELPMLDLERERMDQVELAPFAGAFAGGVPMAMVGHYLVPALTGSPSVPISVSPRGLGVLRETMGFDGVIITDALDMKALDQGAAQVVEFIAMINAGVDLMLVMPDPGLRGRAITAIELGHARGLIDASVLERSKARISALRSGVEEIEPDPSLVGSVGHLDVARTLADRSVTLVRDLHGLLPLSPQGTLLVLEPVPTDVTPADTTALYPPCLAEEISRIHPSVTSLVYPQEPSDGDIAAAVHLAEGHDVVVVGTVAAPKSQGRLVEGLLASGRPVAAVALRTPYDLAVYPDAGAYLCTYSGHRPSMAALARGVFGKQRFQGRLPVPIEDLHPR